jgi:hypothetical protein
VALRRLSARNVVSTTIWNSIDASCFTTSRESLAMLSNVSANQPEFYRVSFELGREIIRATRLAPTSFLVRIFLILLLRTVLSSGKMINNLTHHRRN